MSYVSWHRQGARTFRFASRQNGVYLVHKDDSRLHAARHCKQGTHHLLALPYPFAGEGGGTDVEKGGLDIAGNGLANQGFTCAWRAKQKQPFGRGPGTLHKACSKLGWRQ